LNSIQKAWIAIGVAVALAGGLLFWQLKYNKPKDAVTSLSKDDISLLLDGASPQALQRLKNDPAERKNVINQLRELLAFAAEARATGIDKDPKIKTQMNLNKSVALMNAYLAKHQKDMEKAQKEGKQVDPATSEPITKEEINAFLQKPGTEEKFKQFVKDAQEAGQLPPGEMQEAQLGQLKEQWGRVFVGEEKAIKAGLDKERKTQLQVAIQQAVVLARAFSEKNVDDEASFKATDEEIEAWIASYPEYDTKPKRAKAEALLKRAKAGESFIKLANENTDDPGNLDAQGKKLGGYYEFGRGVMVKEFEDASFALRPGQISGIVETQYGYHIIKLVRKLKKKINKTLEDVVQVRHILVSTMVKDSDNKEVSLKEMAKSVIEGKKHLELVDKLAKKHSVVLPDDFQLPS